MRALIMAVIVGLWPALLWAEGGTLTVTGEGRAAQAPDMAVLTLGVTERERMPARAMDTVSERMETLLQTLSDASIDPADIQTSSVTLQPVYGQRQLDGASEIVAFEASNSVTVRVRALPELGALLAAVLDDGANRLSGLRFALADPQPVLDAARRAAVADARAKAALYAEAAGVSLGSVLSLSEGGSSAGPMPAMAMMEARSVSIAAGEAELTAQVTIVYAISEQQ